MSNLHDLNPTLVAIANEYSNCLGDYAHPCLFVKVRTCSKRFDYREFDKELPFKLTNQYVGSCSNVHEIDQVPSQLKTGKVEDYGLEVKICYDEIQAQNCACEADARLNLEERGVRRLVDQLWLGKEKRAFDQVFDVTNYTVGENLFDWTGNEINNGGDALAMLKDLIDCKPGFSRPTHAIMPRWVFSALERHPSFLGAGCCNVINSKEIIAGILGLQEICCSDAYIDVNGLGLAPDLQPIINNSILLFHRDDRFDAADCGTANFAHEVVYAPDGQEIITKRKEGCIDNWDMGLRGGVRIKAGYSSKFLVNYDLGCLITNAVLPKA